MGEVHYEIDGDHRVAFHDRSYRFHASPAIDNDKTDGERCATDLEFRLGSFVSEYRWPATIYVYQGEAGAAEVFDVWCEIAPKWSLASRGTEAVKS